MIMHHTDVSFKPYVPNRAFMRGIDMVITWVDKAHSSENKAICPISLGCLVTEIKPLQYN